MSSVTFGGLATGIDTNSIIDVLMKVERRPIDRLQKDKTFFASRLKAFSDLDAKLNTLKLKSQAIDTPAELNTPSVTLSTSEFFTASASSTANMGNYQVEVVSLAQRQKDVSQGYTSSSTATFGTGNLTLNVGGVPGTITIDATNNSLAGIAGAINAAKLGVSASIINDGSATPYRLVLTADTVDATTPFSLDATALTGGTEANPLTSNVVAATQAEIKVDTISIKSNTNTITDGIPGVTLELVSKNLTGVTTSMALSSNPDATKVKIKDFVTAYNSIISFIDKQKDADWGHDSALRSVTRRMQDMLTTAQTGGTGTFTSLSQLGFETQRDGTILFNEVTYSDAATKDFASVISLVAGETGVTGVSSTFSTYLTSMTDTLNGLYVSKKEGSASNIRRTDAHIARLEARMVSREKMIRAQFSAMEGLVSSLNSQSSFLSQQMSSLRY
ncbi:MAG: flagellar filament capping protein FliD [Geopsychrobacter sp.]|nr:flagellar filament capping protein FliD [Geopsychrobacter sp.]